MSRPGKHIARNFYPGGRWLYIKIYGGITTCDQLLTDVVYPAITRLLRSKAIVNWFFIRYNDPDFHLRIRVQLSSCDKLHTALYAFNRRLEPKCNDRLIHKVTIDTYEREVERYGEYAIDTTELLFGIDSHCICQLLKPLLNAGKGSDRWRLAFVWADAVMDALGIGLQHKWELMQKMSGSYMNEFGFNEHNIKTLAKRYRNMAEAIENLLKGQSTDEPSYLIIKRYSNKIKRLQQTTGMVQFNTPSILHMSMNRMFASHNRLNELVLYYCLERHYRKEVKKAEI